MSKELKENKTVYVSEIGLITKNIPFLMKKDVFCQFKIHIVKTT